MSLARRKAMAGRRPKAGEGAAAAGEGEEEEEEDSTAAEEEDSAEEAAHHRRVVADITAVTVIAHAAAGIAEDIRPWGREAAAPDTAVGRVEADIRRRAAEEEADAEEAEVEEEKLTA